MAYIINSLKLSVICILLMTLPTSCMIGEKGSTPDSGFVDIVIAIPDSPKEVIESRHGDPVVGEPDESKIATLSFIVFDAANVRESYKQIIINTTDNTSSDPMWDPVKLTMRLVLIPGQKTIYVVANWSSDDVETASMPTLSTVTTPAALEAVVRTHTNFMPSGVAPVMTGKLSVLVAGGDLARKISLTRQIARVDVYPMINTYMQITEANISIEGIRFINMATVSYLFPQTTLVSPVGVTTWDQPDYIAATSGVKVTAMTMNDAILYSRSYIPEYIGLESSATTMLIKAKYNGMDTYYKIVLDGPSEIKTTNLYQIERNHIYEYYVTIQGIGSETAAFSPFDHTAPGVANVKYVTEIR